MHISKIFVIKTCATPGWERHAIALASAKTRHIKNMHVVCHTPKTLYGRFLICPWFIHLLHSKLHFFTVALTKYSVCLRSTLYLLLFFLIITFSFFCTWKQLKPLCMTSFTSVCCLRICNNKYSRCYDFVY